MTFCDFQPLTYCTLICSNKMKRDIKTQVVFFPYKYGGILNYVFLVLLFKQSNVLLGSRLGRKTINICYIFERIILCPHTICLCIGHSKVITGWAITVVQWSKNNNANMLALFQSSHALHCVIWYIVQPLFYCLFWLMFISRVLLL